MMIQWHYTANGNRHGPIPDAEFRSLIARGQVPADAFVWHEGLPQWMPLSQIGGLPQAIPPTPATAATASAVSYFNPGGGIPARAAETLRGHARPAGDTGDWPLDDARLAQFEAAFKLRKQVSAAANLYRALLVFSAIGGALILIGALIAVATSSSSGRAPRSVLIGLPIAISGAVVLAFAALYWLTWRATSRSHRWAPLTMFIIYLAVGGLQILGLLMASVSNGPPGSAAAQNVGSFISLLFVAAFAYVSWRAFSAIPKYLASPAWCQELLVKAGV